MDVKTEKAAEDPDGKYKHAHYAGRKARDRTLLRSTRDDPDRALIERGENHQRDDRKA